MENNTFNPLKDKIYLTGIVFVLLSTALFLIPVDFGRDNDFLFVVFSTNFMLAVIYFIILLFNSILRFKFKILRNHLEHVVLLLMLLLISCFSLNRELPIFSESVDWMVVYLCITGIAYVSYGFRNLLPVYLKYTLNFIYGAGIILHLYYSLYLVPYYGLSAMVIWFFGLSIHSFVPLFLLITTIAIICKEVMNNQKSLYYSLGGIMIPLLFTGVFLYQWHSDKQIIEKQYTANKELPAWVNLAQNLNGDWVSERILKSELVYDVPEKGFEFWRVPSSFAEVIVHDPLVIIGNLLFGKIEVSLDDKVKILESTYKSRHIAQERLWTGRDLKTKSINTVAQIFPQHRIAYTEKTIEIKNKIDKKRWRNTQEAIYTFYLPEGSIVTSLSLWINGIEEKGYLTTKGKADSAYKTIVGVERRDPSLVHWQEGNTVSVRVFPCTPDEDRKVKIGFTSPLRSDWGRISYQNIYFDGPDASNATENIKILIDSSAEEIDLPYRFDKNSPLEYSYEGRPINKWEISFRETPLEENCFRFGGHGYSIKPLQKSYTKSPIQNIYLDINKNWSREEYKNILEYSVGKNLYCYTEMIEEITDANQEEIFQKCVKRNFTLFPFHKIEASDKSLVITKNTEDSPNIKDIAGCEFSNDLKNFLANKQKIKLFNIGHLYAPYLKTLKELRAFHYDEGDINALKEIISKEQFQLSKETDHQIIISQSGISIEENNNERITGSPDHIYRLYTYNHIMKEINADYFNESYIREELINQASKANVVSPLSSLIVLETQEDYERFDIKKNINSLGNATIQNSGAVPEPHEWMLIILTGCIGIYLVFKRRKSIAL